MIGEQEHRLRECAHRRRGSEGEFYSGTTYLEHLQRLPSAAALKVASDVAPFFWSDAAHIRVWLCDTCAAELRLVERNLTRG